MCVCPRLCVEARKELIRQNLHLKTAFTENQLVVIHELNSQFSACRNFPEMARATGNGEQAGKMLDREESFTDMELQYVVKENQTFWVARFFFASI